MKENKWLKQYKENYEMKSAEAKSVEDYLKENYKGNAYIPWATMERLTYMQDPEAKFEKIRNEQGGLVHTDSFVNDNLVENKDGIVSRTSAAVVSHFVKVSLTFLGKEFVEEYPIQEQDYSPAKIYNQNLVNKALQRALAKVASRATGIGLKLYENKDLQFEDKEEDKKPTIGKTTEETKTTKITKTTKKVKEPEVEEHIVVDDEPKEIVETPSVIETEEPLPISNGDNNYSQEVKDLCNLIKTADTDKMTKILQSVNVSILKQYGFALKLEDTDDVLCEKLNHFKSVSTFTNAIKNMLGV